MFTMMRAFALIIAGLLTATLCLAQGVYHTTTTTIAPTAGTFSLALASSDTRHSCVIGNNSASTGYCQYAASAAGIATTANAIPVPAGGLFSCNDPNASNVVHQESVFCTCATGSCQFVIDSTGQ